MITRMVRIGNALFPIPNNQSEKNAESVVKNLGILMNTAAQIEEFECDCIEKMAEQDTFTKKELFQIMHCPVKH